MIHDFAKPAPTAPMTLREATVEVWSLHRTATEYLALGMIDLAEAKIRKLDQLRFDTKRYFTLHNRRSERVRLLREQIGIIKIRAFEDEFKKLRAIGAA